VRHEHIYELWFYVNVFARYPPDMFGGALGVPLRRFLTFVVPVMVAVAVPAEMLGRSIIRPGLVAYALAASTIMLWLSRRTMYAALRHYRSASS
jgi:ABC-2 type transport system permease protein